MQSRSHNQQKSVLLFFFVVAHNDFQNVTHKVLEPISLFACDEAPPIHILFLFPFEEGRKKKHQMTINEAKKIHIFLRLLFIFPFLCPLGVICFFLFCVCLQTLCSSFDWPEKLDMTNFYCTI